MKHSDARSAGCVAHTVAMPRTRVFSLAFLLVLAGCATPTRPPVATPEPVVVPERYVSPAFEGEELDSLAFWAAADGPRVIASGKSSHRLSVFDADTGARLRTFGGPNVFERPNGVAVLPPGAGHPQPLLFVVERDSHRVQAFALPAFAPVGKFGGDVLRSPYGIWIDTDAAGGAQAYVTDSFMQGARFDVVPPLPELAQRVRRFRLSFEGGRVGAALQASFGDTTPQGALRIVESLAGDAAYDRLLVADEYVADGRRGSNLREYTLAGRYTGRSLPPGSFDAEAEGVALWPCRDGRGYWVAVDQLTPLTRFHVFDRDTLALAGTWQGKVASDTDGIALHAAATRAFPSGALYAVHQDKALAAFDLGDVVRALRLSPACAR